MNQAALLEPLSDLFSETGKAHHRAFSDADGEDPDWAIWYARHIHDSLQDLLGRDFEVSRLVYCLVQADDDHRATSPEEPWSDFYARHFLECYADSEAPTEDQLALYYYPTCPYCHRVQRVIDRLGLDVDLRNTIMNPTHRNALMEARGNTTVPVLWIQSPDGDVRWMPESLDIVEYLERTYGDNAAA